MKLAIGDEITINGICKDGRIDDSAPSEDLRLWSVKGYDGNDIILQPMLTHGIIDEFNDSAGGFRIKSTTTKTSE